MSPDHLRRPLATCSNSRCCRWLLTAALLAAQGVGTPTAAQEDESAAEPPVKLLHQLPFDRITLNAASGNAVIDVQLLDVPDRRKLRPLPDSGAIQVRRLSQPSVPYEVSWSAIAKVELFEELLLAEAERLTAAGEFNEAFEYLAFLFRNYADLAGLEQAAQQFLWQDASAAFREERLDDALASLLALHDRNPQFPRLVQATNAVGDALVKQRLQTGDFAGARSVIDSLESSFTKLRLRVISSWRERFRTDATDALATAREALQQEDYAAARAAVQQAQAIVPGFEGAAELLTQIQEAAPEIRVGVLQLQPLAPADDSLEWTALRQQGLVDPQLVEMVAFGAEGGEYASRWADIESDEVSLTTTLSTTETGRRQGITPAAIARRLVEMANPASPVYADVYAALAKSVEADGGDVQLAWRRPHIRPAALLQTPIRTMGPPTEAGLWFTVDETRSSDESISYQRSPGPEGAPGPRFVIEQTFTNDDAAVDALVTGQIDVLDRVPPWQLDRLSKAEGVRVARYRLPTVHVLVPNYKNPLLEIREFRRALCYAIDRAGIVDDLLLAGKPQIGFRPLSGPFLAGENATDPAGYAYRPQLEPRPYEPRLAAVLAAVARTNLAKREQAAAKAAAEEGETAAAESQAPESTSAEQGGDEDDAEAEDEPPPALRLAHSADPVARLACQTIETQLEQVGIPVDLVELTADELRAESDADAPVWDLMYLELAVWEPIVDARRLLGPRGMAGRSSAYMNLALDRVEQAENWSQVIRRAKELHGIAHYDLPVVPLWQTVNYFARRTWLKNVGDQPVTLYQNLFQWQKVFGEGGR